MRNHNFLPVIAWDGKNSAVRARAQILHGEPLILEMGSDFGISVEAGECGCHTVDEGKHFMGCDPKCTLALLADINRQPLLAKVGEAAKEAGLLVDLDRTHSRIIIYD